MVLATEGDGPLPLGSLLATCYCFQTEPKATSGSLTSILWLAQPKPPRLLCIQRRRGVAQNIVRTERAVRLVLEAHHQLSHQCFPSY
jgi:hypothetical protein